MKVLSQNTAFGGMQGVFSHPSQANNCEMTFAVFVPPQAVTRPCPVVWYLSGLTCTHANVMEKGEYRRMAAELGLIVICPDTSPRGNDVADELTNWQMGKGAGFYLDATRGSLVGSLPDVHLCDGGTARLRRAAFPHRHGTPGYLRPFDGRARRHDDRAQEPRPFQQLLGLRADRRALDCRLVGRRVRKISGRGQGGLAAIRRLRAGRGRRALSRNS